MECRVVPITEEHIDGFRAVFDAVAREHQYLAFLEAPPPEAVRAFVRENIRAGHPQFVAIVDHRVVGWCDVLPKPRPVYRHSGVLGIGIAAGHRGRGIGKQLLFATLGAARARGITRVDLTVRADNLRAKVLYERFGFETEGVCRRDFYVDGAYYDTVLMALLFDLP